MAKLTDLSTHKGDKTDEMPANEGQDICVYEVEDGHVICPDCSNRVPTSHAVFGSQGAANDFARAHCTCQESETQGGEETENEQGDYCYGTCRFCGQTATVYNCHTEAEADEATSEMCNCPPSNAHYADEEQKRTIEEKRTEKLANAALKINELFGEECECPIHPDLLEYLKQAPAMLYDHKIKRISIVCSDTITAMLFRMAKGNMSIERKDSATEKAEI